MLFCVCFCYKFCFEFDVCVFFFSGFVYRFVCSISLQRICDLVKYVAATITDVVVAAMDMSHSGVLHK